MATSTLGLQIHDTGSRTKVHSGNGLNRWLSLVCLVLIALPGSAKGTPQSGRASCKLAKDAVSRDVVSEDFSTPALDPCTWVTVEANWGGQVGGEDYNGGVLAANVSWRDGVIVLNAHGNKYTGPARGINLDGSLRRDGRRTGAALMTRQRYLGGRFEARVKIIEHLGVVSAMWTFFYHKSANGTVANHEIDIEFPGQADKDGPPSLKHAMLTTWTGLKAGQATTAFTPMPSPLGDRQFHVLRFDWRPPTSTWSGAVSFYLDGQLKHISRTNVPSKAGNLWLGAWFPPQWAGEPEFDEAAMLVDWVKISPLTDRRP